MTTQPSSISLQSLTQRSVRAWWADGLWDLAVAGFCLLTAAWVHVFVRVYSFPTWTWPWPFITAETVNPMQVQFLLWVVGFIPFCAAYTYGAYRLVAMLKTRWLASRQGDVRHPFWLKVEPRVWVLYLFGYLGLFVVLTWLTLAVTGGAHLFSTIVIAAFTAILLALGSTYALSRYLWGGAIGLVIGMLVELFATTHAETMVGPRNLLDVGAMYGNPAIPLLIFAGVFVITGLVGLVQVLTKEPDANE
jgi:hypothetical protein